MLLVLATLVPLLAFSIFLVYEQQSAGRRAQERDLLQAARAAAAALDDSFATTVLDLRALASSIHLDTGDLRAFHEQARRVQGAYVDWTSVSLFDPSGQRLLYTPEPLGTVLPPRPGAMAERFRILVETREPGVSDLFLLPTAKRWGIAIAVPVIRERQVRYVLSAGVDGAALAGVLARQHAPRDWILTLVDRRGVVAASSREPERQGQPAPANPAAGGAADGVARSTAADGTSTYVAYSRSPHFGWTAILTAPAAALQAGAIRPLWAVAAMGVVLALAGTVLAVGLGRGVDRSVRSIVAEADRLGRGETPRPVASPIRETRELSARLAAAGQERARAEEEIQGRARQQAALAEFGRRAFSGADVDALFADALRVVADTLGVESVVLLERLPDGTALRMRAGLGVPEGMVGTLTVPASADTPAGQSLRSGEPVVIGDIREQAEYEVPARVSERGIVSTVTVPVAAGEAVWGVLGAYATRPRAFVRDEVSFLQTLASMLGAVVERATVDAERASYADRLAILHDVDRALIAERSPEAIAEAVLSRLRDLLRVPRAIVNVFDLEAGEVEWLAAVGRKRMHVGPGIRYPLALAGDTEALRRGEPQVVNVDTLPPSAEVTALLTSGVQYYMVVPMVAAGELIGSVSFGGPSREFPAEQVDIAQARLHEQVKRQAVELARSTRSWRPSPTPWPTT